MIVFYFSSYVWWATVLFLLLRTHGAHSHATDVVRVLPPPIEESQCRNSTDCVFNGLCVKESAADYGYCLCFSSCPNYITVQCKKPKHCGTLSNEALERAGGHNNRCNMQAEMCVCPASGIDKCAKHDMALTVLVRPRDTPYRGERLDLACCSSVDPREHVTEVEFVHNGTVSRAPTETPYERGLAGRVVNGWFERCWYLNISHVNYRDSGEYACRARSSAVARVTSAPVTVQVRGTVIKAKIVPADKASALDRSDPQRRDPMVSVRITNVSRVNSSTVIVEWQTRTPDRLAVNLTVFTSGVQPKMVQHHARVFDRLVVTGLRPATWYTILVRTIKLRNNLTAEEKTHVQTDEAPPGPPNLLNMVSSGFHHTACEIEFEPPLHPNGRIIRYEVEIRGVVRRQSMWDAALVGAHRPSSDNCANLTRIPPDDFVSCKFTRLLPNRNYSASVVAVNSAGRSPAAQFVGVCETDFGAPTHVPAPVVASSNGSLLVLRFDERVDDTAGPISCTYVAVVPLLRNASADEAALGPPARMDVDSADNAFRRNVAAQSPKPYAFVSDSFTDLPSEVVVGDAHTHSGGQPCPVHYLSRYAASDQPLMPGLKYTGFLITRVDPDESLGDAPSISGYGRRRRRQQPFVHQPKYSYSAYFEPVLLGVPLPSTVTQPPDDVAVVERESWLALVFVFLLLVILLAIVTTALVYVSHRRGWLKYWLCFEKNVVPGRTTFSEVHRKNKDFQPIAVEELALEYIQRHRDSDFLFAMEFEALPHHQFDTTSSDRRESARKNRYNDIKAFDVTRVKLRQRGGDPASDYINANYIGGYKGRKRFIAAQGPLLETVADFWRMVFEQKVQIVVMVTNLHEKYRVQCTKYWPEDESSVAGDLEVIPTDATFYADYVVRQFELRRVNERLYDTVGSTGSSAAGESSARDSRASSPACARSVLHYHYTGWHDYRAPECTTGLLRFLMRLRALPAFSSSPVVVHCSAGVGRTGTFITIDGVLDQCADEGHADVFGFVSNLRRQRNFMVQSLEQYVFVYKALSEWFTFGSTDVDVDCLVEHVARLRKTAPMPAASQNGSGGLSPRASRRPTSPTRSATGMQQEFAKLQRSLENGRASEFAKKDGNERKNRDGAAVPFDRNRVILAPVLGHVDASYINASVVRGYFIPYILAQDPVGADSCYDFWRMVCEQNAACVVTLSCESEFAPDETFWPTDVATARSFGDAPEVTVRLVESADGATCATRKLTVSSSKDKQMRDVVQFVYKDWPLDDERRVPGSVVSLLELIGRVLKRLSYLPDSGPIVVHCRDGSTRSGLYCAVSLLLERLKAESRVDVFQTVKSLQAQRQRVVDSLEQYAFAYDAVLEYLSSFT